MQGKVNRIIASETDATQASAVKITDKDGKEETLEADVVVMGVGVAPATEFLKQSTGFPSDVLQRDGGIAVDDLFKVRGLEDVYAIGDIAFYPQIFSGESRRIEHWNVRSTYIYVAIEAI
jgi:NADH dehydrogenase FAD-containing subunit